MPTKEQHLKQYSKNKTLANSNPLTNDENNDWRITMIFYASMHLLESSYALKQVHTSTHEARKKFMSSNLEYNPILLDYDNLEMLSRKARYNCIKMKEKHVKDALRNMETIENFVKNIS